MAIVIDERPAGRRKGQKNAERQYVIKSDDGGTVTEDQAFAALLAGVPATVGTFELVTSDCDVEEIAANIYYGTAVWTAPGTDPDKQEVGNFSISFDISGTNQKRMYSLRTVNKYNGTALGITLRDFHGAIGVNEDGTVEGCDVLVPTTTFSLDYTVAPADITDAYVAMLSRTVGKVNSATYKGFAAGELLLTRVSGRKRDEEAWDLSFGFAVSENRTDLKIGVTASKPNGVVQGDIVKDGWDYLWVYYKTIDNPTTKVVEKRLENVFVERVYERADFAATLNLP